MPSKPRATTRRAFALLTTMLVLTLLIAVTAELSTTAVTGTLAMGRRVNTLHHELAVGSALLLINEQLQSNNQPSALLEQLDHTGTADLNFEGGEVHVHAWIRSDAMKLNPVRWQNPDQQSALARKLTMLQQRLGLSGRLEIQPLLASTSGRPRYWWFDQLVADADPESFFQWGDGNARTVVWSDAITFWGDGKIDLRFAAVDVLDAALDDIRPGLASAMLSKRPRDRSLDFTAAALESVPSEVRAQVAQRVGFGINRYAVHLETSLGGDRRQWYVVAAMNGDKNQVFYRGQIAW